MPEKLTYYLAHLCEIAEKLAKKFQNKAAHEGISSNDLHLF
jgi:hypothetical protein